MVQLDEADRLDQGLRHSFADLLSRVEGGRLEDRAGHRLVVCPRVPFPGLNGLWVDGPDASIRAGELERAISEVEGLGLTCWIELRAGLVPASEALARRVGFSHEEAMPGMVVRPAELAIVPGPGPGVEVIRVDGLAGLADAANIAAAGFGVPAEHSDPLFTLRVAAPGVSIYVAYAGGRPVSTVTTWVGDGTVGVYNVATPPEDRGRGYGRAVTAHALREAFKDGADLGWLQASPLGEPVYRAMGFRQVDTYLVLSRPPTD